MASITTRAGKGSPLTNAEVDANFTDLNTELGQALSRAGGTMTGAITFAAGQTWPTFNQNTTGSAASLTTGRTIGMTGDVTWTSGSFNGTANVTGTATLSASGVTAGTYGSAVNIPQITVDAKGRLTDVSNVAVSIPSGSLTFTGDVTGTGSTGSSTTLTLANSGVTAGTYTKVTVDAKGRVTTGASLSSSDVTSALGYTPYNSTNPSGYITGINSSMVTTALGYTPYNSSNPSGYITAGSNITGTAAGLSNTTWARVTTAYGYIDFGPANTSYAHIYTDRPSFYFNAQLDVLGNRVLNAGNYTSYSPSLTGSGASGTWGINVSGTAAAVSATVTGTNATNLVYGNMADNDQARIRVGGDASNSGWLEIATADDGNEPIYVRQYTGVFGSVTRTLTLLDGSGNTSIPGSLSIAGNTAIHAGNYTSYAVRQDYNTSLNSDTRNTRGVTRLYRRDENSDYSVQTYWTGSYWRLYGYNGDTGHADTHVGYANSAGSASSASTSSQVTINYNNDSNSTYQMLWGSGNSVYGTGGIYCNPSSDYLYAGSFYCGNWFRSSGSTGWYNESYAVGIYATEATNVRTYNSANFIAGGNVTAYSDERVKTNWRALPSDFLEQLAGLKSGIYDRTDTSTAVTQVGVGAQSLEKFLPEAIVRTGNDELSVAYGNAALVSAVELAKRVLRLEAQLAKLIGE